MEAKLKALVKAHIGRALGSAWQSAPLPAGAALWTEQAAWVLVDDARPKRLGGVLAWAGRRGVQRLELIVAAGGPGGASEEGAADAAGVIARRASLFAQPQTSVYRLAGTELVRADPAPPACLLPVEEPPGTAAASELAGLLSAIRAAGATPVWEQGTLRAEVLGLEVARLVDGVLEVGVGRHDRRARAEMNPEADLKSALGETVAAVLSKRRLGAPAHPANTLAVPRWMRAVCAAHPELLGFKEVRSLSSVLPWDDLADSGPAPALARAGEEEVVVVFGAGSDLDLVPSAADCRLALGEHLALVVVTVEGDRLPVQEKLASALRRPSTWLEIPKDWRRLP